MYTYKVVIVDDDEIAADNLALELKAKPEFSVEGVARNARLAKRLIDKVHPELLFLDVEMPDMTGMELLQDIRDSIVWNMRVVFYTAYDKYMIQAIRESAFDYLLKPFQHQDLEDILKRFLQQMQMGQRTQSRLLSLLRSVRRLWSIPPLTICGCCGLVKLVFSAIRQSVNCGK